MILEYIIQVILFQLGFLVAYELLLKKETFFSYNRWYLLLAPSLALLLPLLKIEFLTDAVQPVNVRNVNGILLPEVIIGSAPVSSPANSTEFLQAGGFKWWSMVYFAGFVLSSLFFFQKFRKLNGLMRNSSKQQVNGIKLYQVKDSEIAFTFLDKLFIGDQISTEEREQILAHEMVHIKEKHSLDLIFFEILKIIFWFNPLIYMFQNRLAVVHEFIADETAIQQSGKKNYYEQLLNSAFGVQKISFINQFFNHSLIKKRILMLQKSKSSTVSKFKFLFILPLLLGMLTYVACSENQNSMEETTANATLQDNTLVVQVGDITNQTEDEKAKVSEALAKMNGSDAYSSVKIIGNEKTIVYQEDPTSGKAQIQINRNDGKVTTPKSDTPQDFKVVPFAVIDQVPTFPECEDMNDREAQKFCVSQKIANQVNENFDTSLGKELGLSGVNRVVVQFRIDEQGSIDDARARAIVSDVEAREKLQAEAVRVIKGLPKMNPGIQNGKPVSVMYSLPIVFKVD